jgi:hypothetical protein
MKSFMLFIALSLSLSAQDRPTLFITPTGDHFEVYLAAALTKKHVPVVLVTDAGSATLVITSIQSPDKTVDGAAIARCAVILFSCGRIVTKETAVQLLKGDIIVWSYAANQKNLKSSAEDIAKHMTKDYFHK